VRAVLDAVEAAAAAEAAAGVELWEEQAVLLSKVRDHGAALRILVGRLRDPARAEEYCRQRESRDDAQVGSTLPPRLLSAEARTLAPDDQTAFGPAASCFLWRLRCTVAVGVL